MNAKEFLDRYRIQRWDYSHVEVLDILEQYEVMRNKQSDRQICQIDSLQEELGDVYSDLNDSEQRRERLESDLRTSDSLLVSWKSSCHDAEKSLEKALADLELSESQCVRLQEYLDEANVNISIHRDCYRELKNSDMFQQLEITKDNLDNALEEKKKWYQNYCSVVASNRTLNMENQELIEKYGKLKEHSDRLENAYDSIYDALEEI